MNILAREEIPQERCFSNRCEMDGALARDIATRLRSAITLFGHASLVASGGTTPAHLYDLLGEVDLDWSRVFLTFSDERWIEPSEDGSNEKFIRTRLMQGRASAARLVPMKTAHATAREAQADVHRAVSAMPRPFDVTLLGMGLDGHTASLYPHSVGLAEALDVDHPALVRAIRPPNIAQLGERMSLTLGAILDSRVVMVLLGGAKKRAALDRALAGDDTQAMPIRAVLHQHLTSVQICWAPD